MILYLLTGLAALSIILALVGSIMKSAAEKTLKGGTDLMSGGKAFLGGGARRLASTMRKKEPSAWETIQTSDANVNDDAIMIDEQETSWTKPRSSASVRSRDCFNLAGKDEEIGTSESDNGESHVDVNRSEIVINNVNAVQHSTPTDDAAARFSSNSDSSRRLQDRFDGPMKTGSTSSIRNGSLAHSPEEAYNNNNTHVAFTGSRSSINELPTVQG